VKRPSPALVISIIALFVALGGTSIAAFKLKPNSVGSKQVKNDSLTGTDVNESALGKVPSAALADKAGDATHAATADNADSLGGFTSGNFVLGNGVQFAAAGGLANGATGGISFFAGDLFVHCSATPILKWENDAPGDGFPTDIWTSAGTPAGHQTQADGGAPTTLDSNMPNKSEDVEVWTGNDVVISVRVSVYWDGANCQTAMFTNAEFNTGLDTAAGGTRAKDATQAPRAVGLTGRG
jgi:hypothetical protein